MAKRMPCFSVAGQRKVRLTESGDTLEPRGQFGWGDTSALVNPLGIHSGCGGVVTLAKSIKRWGWHCLLCKGCGLCVDIPAAIEIGKSLYQDLNTVLCLLRRERRRWFHTEEKDRWHLDALTRDHIETFLKFWKALTVEERGVYVDYHVYGMNMGEIGERCGARDVEYYPEINVPVYSSRICRMLDVMRHKYRQEVVEGPVFWIEKDLCDGEVGMALLAREIVCGVTTAEDTAENRARVAAFSLDTMRMEMLIRDWMQIHRPGETHLAIPAPLEVLPAHEVHRVAEEIGMNLAEMRRIVSLWKENRRPAIIEDAKEVGAENLLRHAPCIRAEVECMVEFLEGLSDFERLLFAYCELGGGETGIIGPYVGATDIVKGYICMCGNEPGPTHTSRSVLQIVERVQARFALVFTRSPLFFVPDIPEDLKSHFCKLAAYILFGGWSPAGLDRNILRAFFLDVTATKEAFRHLWLTRDKTSTSS